MSQKFCYILVVRASFRHVYHMTKAVLVVSLTDCALTHSVYDLKTAQINVQRCLIREHVLYEFELGNNTEKVTENICCAKGDSAIDHRAVTIWFKKFCSICKNLNNQTRSRRPKTVNSEVVTHAI